METKQLKEFWEKIIDNVNLSDERKISLNFLIDDTKLVKMDEENSRLIVTVQSEFSKTIFENEFYTAFVESANVVLNTNFSILFLTAAEWKIKNNPKNEESTTEISSSNIRPVKISSLNNSMTFDNFIISKNNKMLVQASLAIALSPGEPKWNPFFIYGGSGLGKTHLLHAIGNKAKTSSPSIKIKYIEAKDFGKMVHDAIAGNSASIDLENIKQEYLGYDLLLVDDIQLISEWKKAKEVFFAIFSTFLNSGKQIVITSDQYIDELESSFEERYITRFQGGLSVNVVPPDVKASKEIVKLKLREIHDFDTSLISDEAIEFVATHFGANVRELEGAVNRVIFWTIQNDDEREINISKIVEIFQGMTKSKGRGITMHKIISTIAKYYAIPATEIKGKSRKAEIMLPRHLSIYFCRTMLGISLMDIGKEFGRDHTTIMSSIRKIEKEKESDHSLSHAIYSIRKEITGNK